MRLPPERREIAARLHADGLTYAEIGRALHVNPNTVRRWLDPEFRQRMNRYGRDYLRRKRSTEAPD